MAQLYVGTSGWAYPSWKPDFYPAKLPQNEIPAALRHPAQYGRSQLHFPATGQRDHHPEMDCGNAAGFRFGVKAHQVITHIKRLKGTADFVPRFLSTIEPLAQAGKLGPVLFQLPPNLKADAKLLEDFLPALPRAVQAAFEFRHPSWFTDEIFNLLKSNNRALCVAETEERVTPDVVTADFCYYRYRKPSYTADERRAMVDRIREHLGQGRDVFAYFKHEETPEGALYAVEILKEVH